jgi:hypothetical protein
LVGQPAGPPNLKKPTTLRGVVGVWNCESGDRIRGRDGACFHAVGFLVRSERLEHNQCHGLFICNSSSFLDLPLGVRLRRSTLVHSVRKKKSRHERTTRECCPANVSSRCSVLGSGARVSKDFHPHGAERSKRQSVQGCRETPRTPEYVAPYDPRAGD